MLVGAVSLLLGKAGELSGVTNWKARREMANTSTLAQALEPNDACIEEGLPKHGRPDVIVKYSSQMH
jgi:hypothetical protein